MYLYNFEFLLSLLLGNKYIKIYDLLGKAIVQICFTSYFYYLAELGLFSEFRYF